MRTLWDGGTLRYRSGRAVSAPPSFLDALPREPLESELRMGRGRCETLSATVRRASPDPVAWSSVRSMVFDQPLAGGGFDERVARLAAILPEGSGRAALAPQWRVSGRAALDRDLARIVGSGGEVWRCTSRRRRTSAAAATRSSSGSRRSMPRRALSVMAAAAASTVGSSVRSRSRLKMASASSSAAG